MRAFLLIFISFFSSYIFAQTNIIVTNPAADQVMKGNYDPANHTPPQVIMDHDSIIQGIHSRVSPDSLKYYLEVLTSYHNRNTGSDTISQNFGIGAARNWALQKFYEFSSVNNNRLIPSFLQFDQNICNVGRHKNIFAVLPGMDTSDKSIVIIEGHIDSRCAGVCDPNCKAHGAEDNGSGTALVLELARVMSKYSYDHTIVFLLTIGEEQGLYGANAFSQYAVNNNIPIKVVLNNDVIGGIICGETSSPPSCPGAGDIDSTNVRIFSYGGANSPYKSLARFVKLEYKEELLPIVSVPMQIHIMSQEDRSGRGGDHIPFRQDGFTAIRFTAANEHGDASNGPGYDDRQHTEDDVLGIDTNNDGILDSFFVDFNYLARNTVINGVNAGLIAIGPESPSITLTKGVTGLIVEITDTLNYDHYRIGVRTSSNDFDTIFTFVNTKVDTIPYFQTTLMHITAASVDSVGIESLFSAEKYANVIGLDIEENTASPYKGIQLLQNKPNPFDEATTIGVYVEKVLDHKNAFILITDIEGKVVKKYPIPLRQGINEIAYIHGFHHTGTYIYTLYIDDKPLESKKMIFAN